MKMPPFAPSRPFRNEPSVLVTLPCAFSSAVLSPRYQTVPRLVLGVPVGGPLGQPAVEEEPVGDHRRPDPGDRLGPAGHRHHVARLLAVLLAVVDVDGAPRQREPGVGRSGSSYARSATPSGRADRFAAPPPSRSADCATPPPVPAAPPPPTVLCRSQVIVHLLWGWTNRGDGRTAQMNARDGKMTRG